MGEETLSGIVIEKTADSREITLNVDGMFVAIVIPPARKERGVLVAAILAALCSVLFAYVFTAVSGGFAVIISAVVAAAVCALLFPVKEAEADA